MHISRIVVFCLCGSLILLVPAISSAQSLEWKAPGPFTLDCAILKRCVTGQACETHNTKVMISNNPQLGMAKFLLPEEVTAQGVIGMVSHHGKQTLLGSATADAKLFYRVTVFDEGRLTIQTSHANNAELDVTYYGTCRNDSI